MLLFVSSLAATLLVAGVALTQTQPKADDAGRYIVVLDNDVNHPSQVASGIEQRHEGLDVGYVYDSALEGFSAEIPDDDLAAVRSNPQVDYVVPDTRVHLVDQTLPWGVDKIGADVSSTLAGNGSGTVSGVNAYIIDSGVYRGPTSPKKKYRDINVVSHINFYGGDDTDCGDGHATHVAGIVGAKDNTHAVVGVAPGVPLTSVKVIGCTGGSVSTVIEGVEWVTNDAVRSSAESGVFYSVAAGNDGDNACKYSPARAGRTWIDGGWVYNNGVATTAAVDSDRSETGWSNYGDCVDLWAPGVNILSTKNEGGVS